MRSAFVFSGMAFLLAIPVVILAASFLNMVSTGTEVSGIYISSTKVSSTAEGIATDIRDIMEKITAVSTQKATRLAVELSFSHDKPVPTYAQSYFDSTARIFRPGMSLRFIRDIALSGVNESEETDFRGMNAVLEEAIEDYTRLTGLNITLINPAGDTCVPGDCDVFNTGNVVVVPAQFGMYTLIRGDWRLVVRDESSNVTWDLPLRARYTLKFNRSGNVYTESYLIKSYTSIAGFQDPLIWWVLSRWSTLYRLGTVEEESPDITTWPILRSPVEPPARVGNKEVNQSNTSEYFLNDLGGDVVNFRYHTSRYGPSFFDMLEGRWWLSRYYGEMAPLAENGERLEVGLESFIPNDPLKIQNDVSGNRYSSLYHYYFSSFFSRSPYYSYITSAAPYNNAFGYSSTNLANSSFAPPSLIWNGSNFTAIWATPWSTAALQNVYIVTTTKEGAYSFVVSHDIYVDEYNRSGYDNATVNTAIRYNLSWALE
ncbi:MAG: hypothetical protein GXO66_05560 [Euryarchaeota archaeon]|nr:hypothetical protein [Euryarchaeota archaeon]